VEAIAAPVSRGISAAMPRLSVLLAALIVMHSISRGADQFGPYAEPDFPVLTSTVDFRDWEKLGFPKNNIAVRGLIIKLPHDLYVCFDQDLLRVAGVWQGEPGGKFLTFTTIPGISYNIPNKKSEPGQKDLPKPIGKPLMATGLMPGWILKAAKDVTPDDLVDPRPPGPDPNEPGRGPLPVEKFRWEGYRIGSGKIAQNVALRVELTYKCGDAQIEDRFESGSQDGLPAVCRTIYVTKGAEPLSAVHGQPGRNITTPTVALGSAALFSLPGRTVWTLNCITPNETIDDSKIRTTTSPLESDVFLTWNLFPAITKIFSHPASGGFVVDEISLPLSNLWNRNVRPSGIGFFPDGRMVVCTIDGDVWTIPEIGDSNRTAEWNRIASGLHEPQSVLVHREAVLVFTRDGIIRLVPSSDGISTRYENFCNAFTQTGESREYPMDMVAKPDGGFYIAKGGQMITRKTPQGGHVLEVSADGKR